jgi:hypothetical protein
MCMFRLYTGSACSGTFYGSWLNSGSCVGFPTADDDSAPDTVSEEAVCSGKSDVVQ